jgi:hypothetical protein
VIASARWKNGDFRISGTTDGAATAGSTITFYKAAADGKPTTTAISTPVGLTAAVAPATGSTFDARYRGAASGTTNPGAIVAVLTVGGTVAGTSAPFTATNG